MSAVFGLVRLDGGALDGRVLTAMRAALAGHGGDGGGTWAAGPAGFGQLLRAVTPEDLAEDQPLISRGGMRVLVSEGRVDNRAELSSALGITSARPVPDSAFILAAYERWGEDCARHLVGWFSFAIWDADRRRLLVVRSPFGGQPVLFHQAAGFVAFAPLARALFAVPGIARGLCMESLSDCLALMPPAPGITLFEGIRSLEAGHLLIADGQGCRIRAFWEAERQRTLRLGSDQEYVEAFTEVFDRAVSDQLRSRGPTGVMLSGGLDSTSVAATAAPLLARRGERLAAFTGAPRAGFQLPDDPHLLVDESSLAAAVAAKYGNIDPFVVRADGQTFLDGLDQYFDVAETPFEAAANRVWYEAILAAAQQRGVRVLLTGKCGNWTSSWYGGGLLRSLTGAGRLAAAWREAQAMTPGGRPPAIAAGLARAGLLRRLPWPIQGAIGRARNPDDPLLAADEWWAPLSPINPEFARAQDVAGRSRARSCDHLMRRPVDTRAARCERLMRLQRDAAINGGYSARFGLDIRDPTGDVRVAEFCLSLPEDQYRRAGVSRWLIRRAMAERLPAEILTRRGHGIQAADWFERLSGVRSRVSDELAALEGLEIARTVLDLPRMRRLADRIDQPPASRLQQLFDYSLVLQRGLMMGRYLRWFEDGAAQYRR